MLTLKVNRGGRVGSGNLVTALKGSTSFRYCTLQVSVDMVALVVVVLVLTHLRGPSDTGTRTTRMQVEDNNRRGGKIHSPSEPTHGDYGSSDTDGRRTADTSGCGRNKQEHVEQMSNKYYCHSRSSAQVATPNTERGER